MLYELVRVITQSLTHEKADARLKGNGQTNDLYVLSPLFIRHKLRHGETEI